MLASDIYVEYSYCAKFITSQIITRFTERLVKALSYEINTRVIIKYDMNELWIRITMNKNHKTGKKLQNTQKGHKITERKSLGNITKLHQYGPYEKPNQHKSQYLSRSITVNYP